MAEREIGTQQWNKAEAYLASAEGVAFGLESIGRVRGELARAKESERVQRQTDARSKADAERKRRQVAVQKSRSGQKWTDPTTGMKFVKVPEGCFQMGSPSTEKKRSSNETQHKVCLDEFWLGKYEVTQGQWEAVMGSNPSNFKKGDKHPVEQVSWDDAQEFLKKLSVRSSSTFRLPTEAEWEYSCRAGTKTPFSFGNTISADTETNYDGNYPYRGGSKGKYRQSTTPVGSFPANAWGLHDMHGNVWEWAQDIYAGDAYSKHRRKNPIYEASGSSRVNRGGSWDSYAGFLRCAYRYRDTPDVSHYSLGFRAVAVPPGL